MKTFKKVRMLKKDNIQVINMYIKMFNLISKWKIQNFSIN
jgi:hypothetical protein